LLLSPPGRPLKVTAAVVRDHWVVGAGQADDHVGAAAAIMMGL
jgi:hypothetical protein